MSLSGATRGKVQAEPRQSSQSPLQGGSGVWFFKVFRNKFQQEVWFESSGLSSRICDFSAEVPGILKGKNEYSDLVLSDIKLENQKFVFSVRTVHTNRFCLLMGQERRGTGIQLFQKDKGQGRGEKKVGMQRKP